MSLYINPTIYLGPQWLPLCIDHLRTHVAIDDKTFYGFLLGQMWVIKDMEDDFPGIKISLFQNKFNTRMLWTPGDLSIATLEMGIRYKQKYLSLSLFPSNGTIQQLQNYLEVVEIFFDDIYRKVLYKTAGISRVEFALDSLTIPMHSFLAMVPRRRTSSIWKPGVVNGTMNEGSRHGASYLKVYDKAKQQTECGHACPHPICTRIEVTLQKLKLATSKLIALPNPLIATAMMDKSNGLKASNLPYWQSFLSIANFTGTGIALQHFSSGQRKVIKAIFRENPAVWWKPIEAWKALPSALAPLTPP